MRSAPSTPKIDYVFRACADRTRLRVLRLLRSGELCVGDVVAALRLPQPKVSRHLAYLRRARLVVARREGAYRYYTLAPAGSPFHAKLLECLEAGSESFG
jgi:ArsR family transcriptional regulator, arsenate/arsenite/antimonite-responsive transcriptional repressor